MSEYDLSATRTEALKARFPQDSKARVLPGARCAILTPTGDSNSLLPALVGEDVTVVYADDDDTIRIRSASGRAAFVDPEYLEPISAQPAETEDDGDEVELSAEQAQRAASLLLAKELLKRDTVFGKAPVTPSALIELAEYILDGTVR